MFWFLIGLLLSINTAIAVAQSSPTRVNVGFPSMSVGQMPAFIAEANGYWRTEGLAPEMILMRSGVAVQALVGGSVDFVTHMGSSIEAAVRGPKLKVLVVAADRPTYNLVAHPSIRSIKDLKGKKVGVAILGDVTDAMTRVMLKKNGLEPTKDVAVLAIGTTGVRLSALKAAAIHATILPPPQSFLAIKEGLVDLGHSGDYVESLSGGVVTGQDQLSKKPELVAKFVRAYLKAHLFYLSKREESIRIMMDRLAVRDQEVAAQIYDSYRRTQTADGTIPEDLMQRVLEERRHALGIAYQLDPTVIFDFSVAKRAMADLQARSWRP
jgi:NitT/TauT family transport system substrate-binding protein